MEIQELRKEFENETNIAPVFANRDPYISYINWLEARILKQNIVKNNVALGDVSNSLIAFGFHLVQNQKAENLYCSVQNEVDDFLSNLHC